MASMAPSAAPAETPSVKGVASGLRSSACSTTPDDASAAPTSAAASTRGRRATKKICASTFSAQGTEASNARDRLMAVLPSVGARTIAATAVAPKSGSVVHRRRDSARGHDARPSDRHHGEMAGGGMDVHVGLHPIQRTEVRARQHLRDGPGGHDPALAQQHEVAADAGRQVQVVGRDDDRHAPRLVEFGQQTGRSRAGPRDRATTSARRAAAHRWPGPAPPRSPRAASRRR